ncbi:MAG: hypothetical protein AAGD38_10540 [Acidobacteriota bacterium]
MPSHFWIDHTELDALLRAVENPAAAPVSAVTTPVVTSTPTPVSAAKPTPDSFTPTSSSLERRLSELSDWLTARVACDQVFVAGPEGLALFERDADPELVAAASSLTNLWGSLAASLDLASQTRIEVDLDADRVLSLSLANATWGMSSLGIVTTERLDTEMAHAVTRAFRMTVGTE